MCERARRSRDSTSRYSIDTLFPGLTSSISTKGISETPQETGDARLGGSSDPITQPTKTTLPKVRKGMSKGGSRASSSTKDSVTVPARDGNDNGHNLSRISVGSAGGRSGKSAKVPPPRPSSNRPKSKSTPKNSGVSKNSGIGTKRRANSPLKPTPQLKAMAPSMISTTRISRIGMQEAFQPWVLQTYGDSAKTKTITRKKYARIIKTLRGEEVNNAENSKFRFWVKAKGFHIGVPPEHLSLEETSSNEPDLYIPTTVKDEAGIERPIFKRVAVVEQFFDIIYTVHVETEAKNGKHAGQKRTYRAITEKYAFLPREAVTKFLLQCTECQKRGSPTSHDQLNCLNGKLLEADSLSLPDNNSGKARHPTTPTSPLSFPEGALNGHPPYASPPPFDINFSLPFTTTYLRKQRKQMRLGEEDQCLPHLDDEDDSRMSDPNSLDDDHDHALEPMPKKKSKSSALNSHSLDPSTDIIPNAADWLGYHPIALKKERLTPTSSTTTCSNNNSIYSNGKTDFKEQSSPTSLSDRSAVNHETGQDETSSNGNKEDEDDDDEEEDKIDTHSHDPERLKAFNMFVRLFVDENLDRMVPISKQPKEKIQAIIDSCTRQFPEFAERARKRIRTYLKSCRRNKRCRDSNWESSRPTPAHLTSVQAEQILAQACENESQNAKRMRMGLEPVGQPLPVSTQNGIRSSTDSATSNGGKDKEEKDHGTTSGSLAPSTSDKVSSKSTPAALSVVGGSNALNTTQSSSGAGPLVSTPTVSGIGEMTHNGNSTKESTGVRTPLSSSGSENQNTVGGMPKGIPDRNHLLDYSSSRALNGSALNNMSMYRPNFCQAFSRPFPGLFPATTPPATSGTLALTGFNGAPGLENSLPNGGTPNRTFSNQNNVSSASIVPNGNEIGPTDLSMKSKPLISHKLNSTEMSTVRQLITGYRESAAFLLRSADELEQLIIQQQ